MVSSANRRRIIGTCVTASMLAVTACEPSGRGVQITIVDENGTPTAARVSLVDSKGKAWVAGDAVPVQADCAAPWPPADGPSSVLPADGKAVLDP